MRGIHVRPTGDPVLMTFVYAGTYQQFHNWCMYSRVNPTSRLVKYIRDVWSIRGYLDFDLVYTGTPKVWTPEVSLLASEIAYFEGTGAIRNIWWQLESCEIEPSVVGS